VEIRGIETIFKWDWRKTEEELEKSKKWEKSILLLTENNKKIGLLCLLFHFFY
jgi:hypothetical protein